MTKEADSAAALREMDARVLEWWAEHERDLHGGPFNDDERMYLQPPDFVRAAIERSASPAARREDEGMGEETIDRSDAADAWRLRWLLDGHGYFMEQRGLCGHGPCDQDEQDGARREIDEARARYIVTPTSLDDVFAGKVPGIRMVRETHPGVAPTHIPYDPNSFGAQLVRSAVEQGVSVPTAFDIRISLDPGPRGQAIAREIAAVLERAQSPAPAQPEHPAVAMLRKALDAMRQNEAFGDDFPLGLVIPDIEAFLAAQPPAPAWTREAPKEPGRYWVRWPQDGRSVTLDLGYFSGLGWSFGYASGIGHDGEHWPVRVEPPR